MNLLIKEEKNKHYILNGIIAALLSKMSNKEITNQSNTEPMITEFTIEERKKRKKQSEYSLPAWRTRLLHDYCSAFVCITTRSGITEVFLN
jgi:hypothetical protein